VLIAKTVYCKDYIVCNNCLLGCWVIQQYFISKQTIQLQCDVG
jgi:hypothetical protein